MTITRRNAGACLSPREGGRGRPRPIRHRRQKEEAVMPNPVDLERVGDNAVDIGEQVAFLVTGEFREFTDASHPEIEHPELLERGGSPE
jgi:hypothetical protein